MVIELNDDIIILLLLKSYLLIFIPLRYICRKQNSGDTLNVMYRTVISCSVYTPFGQASVNCKIAGFFRSRSQI